jgi:CarD family transcriptional regulator
VKAIVTKVQAKTKAPVAKTKTAKPGAATAKKPVAPAIKKPVAGIKNSVVDVAAKSAKPEVATVPKAAKPAPVQQKISKTAAPTASPVKPGVQNASPVLEQKTIAVTLNITATKVTTAVSSSASPAESVAAALKKAAEKIMVAKVAKTPVTQPDEAIAQEPRLDAKPPLAKAPEAKPVAKPAPHKPAGNPRPAFKSAEFIVYPAHGVGQIIAIEEQEVAGFKLELYVISFIKDKMILKVPTTKVVSVGMRKLAEADVVKKALDTLTGRARVKRTMWSRRAQEYEAKINSGDLGAIAEVVRDLYRSDAQPEQSYSERQLYEAALDRLSREVGTVQKLTETESLKLIETQLQKGPRRSKVEEADAEAETDGPDAEEGDIEEAA